MVFSNPNGINLSSVIKLIKNLITDKSKFKVQSETYIAFQPSVVLLIEYRLILYL